MFKEGTPGSCPLARSGVDIKEPRKSSFKIIFLTEKDQNNTTSYLPRMEQSNQEEDVVIMCDDRSVVSETGTTDSEGSSNNSSPSNPYSQGSQPSQTSKIVSYKASDYKPIELNSIIEGTESNYLVNKFVTNGTYGQVFEAITVAKTDNDSKGTSVALKFLAANGFGGRGSLGSGKLEQELTSRCDHGNIISFTESFVYPPDPRMMIIIMPYYYFGSLESCMTRGYSGYLPHAFGYKIANQLASALAHLQQKKIIHLDVKPGNILVKAFTPTQGSEHIEIKLADLGISKHVLESNGQANELGGTKYFIAPEVHETTFSSNPYSYRADVYSMGATLYNVLSGEYFDYFDENSQQKVEFSWPEVTGWAKSLSKHPYRVKGFFGVEIPAPLLKIISGCLVLDYKQRCDAKDVLQLQEVKFQGEEGQKPSKTIAQIKMEAINKTFGTGTATAPPTLPRPEPTLTSTTTSTDSLNSVQ